MNVLAVTAAAARPPAMTWRRRLRVLALESRCELVKLVREPAFALPTLGFPALFYLLFGVGFGRQSVGPVTMATHLVASYGAFGVMGAALFGFGVGVAVERGQGWLLVKRATPMPIAAYFGAKLVMSVAFGAAIVALLAGLGVAFGGVELAAGTWVRLAGVLVLGAVPCGACGLLFGSLCSPKAAPAVVNAVYLPAAFASGMWIPIQALPGILRDLAPFLPPYHYLQLALKTIGADRGEPVWLHAGVLAGFTLACLAAATLAFWRSGDTIWG
jgi:ABC-2 type transport system permease protein